MHGKDARMGQGQAKFRFILVSGDEIRYPYTYFDTN